MKRTAMTSRAARLLCLAAAVVFLLAALPACGNAGGDSPTVPASPEISAFSSEEEAKKAIGGLQKTSFESWMYESEDVLAFELACTEAVRYVRRNTEDEDYLEKSYELYKKLLETKESVRLRTGDVPRVYVVCRSEIGREEYVGCSVAFADAEGGTGSFRDDGAKIRVRGNSTAEAEKKPYNVKLSSDRGVFGMASGSKWAMLANHFDKSLLRNKVALDLALEAGCWAALDSRYAEVYLNGKFLGSYLVCEPVTDGKNRADVNTGEGEFLVERVKNWAEETETAFYTSSLGLRFDVNASDGWNDRVARIVDEAEKAILSGDEAAIRACVDVESFVTMYVVQEIVKDCDLFYGNCHLCYSGGLLRCGPMWDMDLSMGNASAKSKEEKYLIYNNVSPFGDGGGDSAAGTWADAEWFGELMKTSFFRELAVNRFAELEPLLAHLYEDGGVIDGIVETYGVSFERNYADAGWSIAERASPYETRARFSSHGDAVRDLKDWLRRRHAYLKTVFR